MSRWDLKRLFWITEDEPEAPDQEGASSRRRVDEALASLRDIEGVVGSIAVGCDGAVLGSDWPKVFDESTIVGVGERIARLCSRLQNDADEFVGATLTYGELRLHLGVVAAGVVGVLADPRAKPPGLAMGIKLVGRRIDASLAGA